MDFEDFCDGVSSVIVFLVVFGLVLWLFSPTSKPKPVTTQEHIRKLIMTSGSPPKYWTITDNGQIEVDPVVWSKMKEDNTYTVTELDDKVIAVK